eukprot:TRINITY_DN6721_c0_g3_i1.p2 TRINITY_DN6721_c0_g3~~TRINITY_DN6721_c0_g3_i1.p2  ORF type:complete len:102 (+),score=10.48 TRINITY_DN6721_c0_g3_i1:291-596(+)
MDSGPAVLPLVGAEAAQAESAAAATATKGTATASSGSSRWTRLFQTHSAGMGGGIPPLMVGELYDMHHTVHGLYVSVWQSVHVLYVIQRTYHTVHVLYVSV